VLDRRQVGGLDMLYVHWLALRDPRARFSSKRPKLPGQDVPGLGLVREVTQLVVLASAHLGVAGVAFVPAHYHIAFVARAHFRFVDPIQQGRFEAMLRDLGQLPLAEVTEAIDRQQVMMNGEPFRWEPGEMILGLNGAVGSGPEVAAERDRATFSIADSISEGVQPAESE